MTVQLYETTGNRVPEGALADSFSGWGGVPIRYALWEHRGRKLRGTVCVFNGRGEAIEKYFETIQELRARGFAVAAMDWRGQGGSGRMLRNARKGFVDSFEDYDRDLVTFMKTVVLPDCPAPYFALGHSTGANILLRAARDRIVWFERMVLTSPLIRLPESNPQSVIHRVAEVLTFIGLGKAYAPGRGNEPEDCRPLEKNVLTRDAGRLARNAAICTEAPQLAVGGPTVQWVYAACCSMDELARPDFPLKINLPILFFGASGDKVVSYPAVEKLAQEIRVGQYLEIPGAYHEILMEKDEVRAQFWAAFDAFVPGTPAYGRTR